VFAAGAAAAVFGSSAFEQPANTTPVAISSSAIVLGADDAMKEMRMFCPERNGGRMFPRPAWPRQSPRTVALG